MKTSFVAAAIMAGLVGPASAATTTLDFTTSQINTAGGADYVGPNYTISGGGNLVNATHGNTVGCTGSAWGTFACNDVGFGIFGGTNNNEIEGGIDASEFVVVTFNSLVKIVGFAGMLAYKTDDGKSTETVVLEYSADGGATWGSLSVGASATTAGGSFNTVGLAFLDDLENIFANVVRFTAGGGGDNQDTNVTAAGLKVAPVPIPASFPLLLAGLGALGFAARRKQRKAA